MRTVTCRSSATVCYVSSWFGGTGNWLTLCFRAPHRGLVVATLQLSLERLGGSFSELLPCQIAWHNPSPISSPISYTFDPPTNKRLWQWDGVSIRNVFTHQGEIKMLGKHFPESPVWIVRKWWTRCSHSQWWFEITTMHLVSYEKDIADTWSKVKCM